MVFSAANLNRPMEKCAVCKLDHAPLKPDLLAEIAQRKADKQRAKMDGIKEQLLANVQEGKRVKE